MTLRYLWVIYLSELGKSKEEKVSKEEEEEQCEKRYEAFFLLCPSSLHGLIWVSWEAAEERLVLVKLSGPWRAGRTEKHIQIEGNKGDMTSKWNWSYVGCILTRKEKETYLDREIWMGSVNYLVVLYQYWFLNLDGCYVRVFILVKFKKYLGVMKQYICILLPAGSVVVLKHVYKFFTVPPIQGWS